MFSIVYDGCKPEDGHVGEDGWGQGWGGGEKVVWIWEL
jgi:hypothetical protein